MNLENKRKVMQEFCDSNENGCRNCWLYDCNVCGELPTAVAVVGSFDYLLDKNEKTGIMKYNGWFTGFYPDREDIEINGSSVFLCLIKMHGKYIVRDFVHAYEFGGFQVNDYQEVVGWTYSPIVTDAIKTEFLEVVNVGN